MSFGTGVLEFLLANFSENFDLILTFDLGRILFYSDVFLQPSSSLPSCPQTPQPVPGGKPSVCGGIPVCIRSVR